MIFCFSLTVLQIRIRIHMNPKLCLDPGLELYSRLVKEHIIKTVNYGPFVL